MHAPLFLLAELSDRCRYHTPNGAKPKPARRLLDTPHRLGGPSPPLPIYQVAGGSGMRKKVDPRCGRACCWPAASMHGSCPSALQPHSAPASRIAGALGSWGAAGGWGRARRAGDRGGAATRRGGAGRGGAGRGGAGRLDRPARLVRSHGEEPPPSHALRPQDPDAGGEWRQAAAALAVCHCGRQRARPGGRAGRVPCPGVAPAPAERGLAGGGCEGANAEGAGATGAALSCLWGEAGPPAVPAPSTQASRCRERSAAALDRGAALLPCLLAGTQSSGRGQTP